MALGEKYKIHIDHQFGGDSRYVQLFREGYSGSVSELTGGPTPVVLEYPGSDNDIFDPIYGSEMELTLISTTAEQFIEFATAKNREYLARIYNDTDAQVEWQGWLVPPEYEEKYSQAPYYTTLIFNCGLGLASNYDYLDTGDAYFTGRDTEMAILTNCLKLIYPDTLSTTYRPDLRVVVGLQETAMSTAMTASVLALSYVDQNKYINDDGTVWDVLSVIRDIVESWGARILMSVLGWWVVRIRDYALFADSYEMGYQRYSEEGVYVSYFSLTEATTGLTIAGPAARSSMIGWVGGGQTVRYERAYRQIELTQDYIYKSMIVQGDFGSENWTDFWNTSGAPVRAQDTDGGYYIRLAPTDYIDQTVNDLDTTVTPDQRLILSFEAMVEYPDTYSQTEFVFDVEFHYDAGTIYYLDGQQGSNPDDPLWVATTVHEFLFTTEAGVPPAGKWTKFELNIPKLPSDGDLRIRFQDGQASGGSGSHTATGYRNIKLMGTYDLEAQTKENTLTQAISTDNIIELKDVKIGLGDINLDSDEWVYFKGGKSLNATGLTMTAAWRSTRRNAAVRSYVGPVRTVAGYLMDGLMVQHGGIRKRLTGRMVFDTDRHGLVIIKDGSDYFLPTMMAIDYKRGEVDLSMVELPGMGTPIGDNLITDWTNTNWDTFVSDGDLISSLISTGGSDTAEGNSLSWDAYDKFRVQVDGVDGVDELVLDWGTYDDYINDGDDFVITMGASAGSETPTLFNDGSSQSHTNVTITITKYYGY